jgi:hypothetical protein
VISELYQDGTNVATPSIPRISTVRMESPLIIEVISGSSNDWSIAALGMLAYILKNPGTLTTFRLRAREARNKAIVELAKSEVALEAARAELQNRLNKLEEKSSFQVHGQPIRRFEREYHSRELRVERETRTKRNRGRYR